MIRRASGGITTPPPWGEAHPRPSLPRLCAPSLAVAVLAAIALTACGATHPQATAGTTASRTAQAPLLVAGSGGTATVALDAVPTTLNDHTVMGDTQDTRLVASALWAQVFQIGPLLTPELDTNVVLSAEVVSLSPQTVVYQIAPRATWSDGTPVTGDDFEYAWLSQRGGAKDVDGTADSVATTLGYRDIASVTTSNDGKTVTVVFRTPDADWESLFDDLLPAHIADKVGWNHGFDTFDPSVLVSAGPWVVTSWEPGRRLVLGHNPRWWGPVSALSQIVFVPGGDAPALSQDMSAGRVQVVEPSDFDATTLAQLSALPTVETQTSLGTTMLQLDFNVTEPPLDSSVIRQGIAHTIDRVGIVTQVTQPLEQEAWVDNNHLFANVQPMYRDDAGGYETADLGTAEALLADGGFVADADGTWTWHGAPVTLDLTWADDDPWSNAVGPLVAGQLVSAGFDVDTVPVPASRLFGTVLPTGAYELALVPVDASAFPSDLGGAFSPAAATASPGLTQDWSGFDDASVDALLTQAAGQLSVTQAAALYQQIDQALWKDMPTLPLLAEPSLLAYSSSLLGVQDDPGGLGPLWGMAQWRPLVAAPMHRGKPTSG